LAKTASWIALRLTRLACSPGHELKEAGMTALLAKPPYLVAVAKLADSQNFLSTRDDPKSQQQWLCVVFESNETFQLPPTTAVLVRPFLFGR
jgi:hypothetical protein